LPQEQEEALAAGDAGAEQVPGQHGGEPDGGSIVDGVDGFWSISSSLERLT